MIIFKIILLAIINYNVYSLSPHRAMILLSKYGYLNIRNWNSINNTLFERSLIAHGSYRAGIKRFQKFFNLTQDGILSPKVKKLLQASRCGNPDISSDGTPFTIKIRNKYVFLRQKRYLIDDPRMKWLKKDLTWKITNYPSKGVLSQPQVRQIFTKAFNLWSEKIDLNFREEKDNNKNADIIILFGARNHGDSIPFDGPGTELAHAFYPIGSNSPEYSRGGDVHFDDDETWVVRGNPDGKDLLAIAVHEFGHAMGLGHSVIENAIMYPLFFGTSYTELALHQDDIDGMQKIYGAASPGKYLPPLPEIPDKIPIYTKPHITTTPSPQKMDFCDTTVDTILLVRDVELDVFKGNMQWRIDFSRTVSNWTSYDVRDGPENLHYYWPILPKSVKRIDGGIERTDQKIYMFSGDKFWLFNDNMKMADGVTEAGLSLSVLGLPSYIRKIDAIFRWSHNKHIYIFAGDSYWKIDENRGKFGYKRPNYPRTISANWLGVPNNIDTAFTGLHGTTYFIKGKYYYTFNNLNMQVTGNAKLLQVPWIGCKKNI